MEYQPIQIYCEMLYSVVKEITIMINIQMLILISIISTSLAIISSADATTTLTKTEKIEVRAKNPDEAKKIMKDMENKIDNRLNK